MTRCLEIYTQGLDFAKRILNQVAHNESIDPAEVREHMNLLMQSTLQSPDDFLEYSTHSTPDNFLCAHSVNCLILCVLMGQDMDFPDEKLQALGTAALLHDIGLMKMFDLVNTPIKFLKKERDKIEKHSSLNVEALGQLKEFEKDIIEAILQHHENEDGTGYPSHLTEKIQELASVIHVVDVYEALTHSRPYRNAMLPHAAIKQVVDSKQHFNRRMLKTLLNVVSLFPLGTFVQLNTRAIGKVIKVTRALIMRPTIQLITHPNGQPASDGTIIDLGSDINVHVERCLEEVEISKLTSDSEPFIRSYKK